MSRQASAPTAAWAPGVLPGGRPVVFFDGECGLCLRSVALLLRADRRGRLSFAPLGGETARRLLPAALRGPEAGTMVYLDGRGVRIRSEAVLEACRRIGGTWGLLGVARILPRSLRDPAYRFVARHRQALSGRYAACRVPTPEERGRLLP